MVLAKTTDDIPRFLHLQNDLKKLGEEAWACKTIKGYQG
jgi:hypothetical protein